MTPTPAHLVDVDGNADDDVQQVSERQAGDEDVGPVTHALVFVDDPEQRGVPDDTHDEHQARHHRVDVLEGVADLRGPGAHGRQPAAGHADVGPDGDLHVPLHQPRPLRHHQGALGGLVLRLLLPGGGGDVTHQERQHEAEEMSLHPAGTTASVRRVEVLKQRGSGGRYLPGDLCPA